MSKSKPAKPNAFALFTQTIAHKRCISFPTAIPLANTQWQNMSETEKYEWKVKAKQQKQEQINDATNAVYEKINQSKSKATTTNGNWNKARMSTAQLEEEERKNKRFYAPDDSDWAKKRQRDVEALSQWLVWELSSQTHDVMSRLGQVPFSCLTVQSFCPQLPWLDFVPSEISMADFSFFGEIRKTHRYDVDAEARKYPKECAIICEWEKKGNVQPTGHGFTEPGPRNLLEPQVIVKKMAAAARSSKYIYVCSEDYNLVVNSVEWLKANCPASLKSKEALSLDRFICIEDLVAAIIDAIIPYPHEKKMESVFDMGRPPKKDACSWHFQKGGVCAKTRVKAMIQRAEKAMTYAISLNPKIRDLAKKMKRFVPLVIEGPNAAEEGPKKWERSPDWGEAAWETDPEPTDDVPAAWTRQEAAAEGENDSEMTLAVEPEGSGTPFYATRMTRHPLFDNWQKDIPVGSRGLGRGLKVN